MYDLEWDGSLGPRAIWKRTDRLGETGAGGSRQEGLAERTQLVVFGAILRHERQPSTAQGVTR